MKLKPILAGLLMASSLFFMACGSDDSTEDEIDPTPPIADFSASAEDILEGGSVTFTDNSTNTPTAWQWTFEGGTPASSTDQNPAVTYASKGSYDVKLVASNADGMDSVTMTDLITVCESNFSVTDVDGVTDGELVYNSEGQITVLDLGEAVAEIDYDDQGRLTEFSFVLEGNVELTQTFSYDAEGRVNRVDRERAGDEAKILEYEYTTDGGATIISMEEFEETSPGNGDFQSTGETAEYTSENGNITSYRAYDTDENDNVILQEQGTITYSSEAWRIDHAILFDLEDYPYIFNQNIFAAVTVQDNSGTTVFTGQVTIVGSGENITSVTYTESEVGDPAETTTINYSKSCE